MVHLTWTCTTHGFPACRRRTLYANQAAHAAMSHDLGQSGSPLQTPLQTEDSTPCSRNMHIELQMHIRHSPRPCPAANFPRRSG